MVAHAQPKKKPATLASKSQSRRLQSLGIEKASIRVLVIPSEKNLARHVVSVLKQFLKDTGMTAADLSPIVDVPARTIQSWLAGKALPPQDRIAAVKDALQAEAEVARQFAAAVTAAFGA